MNKYILIFTVITFLSCEENIKDKGHIITNKDEPHIEGLLTYIGTPNDSTDRTHLLFSDKGAWFAYGIPDSVGTKIGFSGPFLMTQQNGIWSSKMLTELEFLDEKNEPIPFLRTSKTSFPSHLSHTYQNEHLKAEQTLTYFSGHTAVQQTIVTNISDSEAKFTSRFSGTIFDIGLSLDNERNYLKLRSAKSDAVGYIGLDDEGGNVEISDNSYRQIGKEITLSPGETTVFKFAHTFIFPRYDWNEEQQSLSDLDFNELLEENKTNKAEELEKLVSHIRPEYDSQQYKTLLAKAYLTLQNNWRIAAGELGHEGLFPSYHYEWFNGFWAWDSWKHAVGLSHYNPTLAKNQIRAMFDFQREDGYVLDCIFRDTTIEKHNYRDTKPPLSAWAVEKIYNADNDIGFVQEMYPKLKKYHYWWYKDRDHDRDSICEYGSTDGTLVAAKWESGMDNAIRFDDSKILKNHDGAYSLNQESVDLNAYLYAEKLFLATLAKALAKNEDADRFKKEAVKLSGVIQTQFYDVVDGWFYDTDLDGKTFIKGAGCEGWTALWAEAATKEQAGAVRNKMMDSEKFFTEVPFQTLSADHPKFNPLKGYWRGPNWLDQAYFGVKGLRNYGFEQAADSATVQILKGANGLLEKGKPIYENYHPLTGEGLNAKNFSWSAAHIITLLTE